MKNIINIIFSILFIQYAIIFYLVNLNLKNKCVNHKNKYFRYVIKMFKYDSMFSLIYKYKSCFLNNHFNSNDSQILKLQEFIGNNTDNYIAIGNNIMIYFYKINGKHNIYVSPLFFDKVTHKYYKNIDSINIYKILTIYKCNNKINLYKINHCYFEQIYSDTNIFNVYDIMYDAQYKNNREIFLYGFCLGGNVCYELCKYINKKYKKNNVKLFTFETYHYENIALKNIINGYTHGSLLHIYSLQNNVKIDFVYKINFNIILNHALKKITIKPIHDYEKITHWKFYYFCRKLFFEK